MFDPKSLLNDLKKQFEEKILQGLRAMGVPSLSEVQALEKRVTQLEAHLAGAKSVARKGKTASASKAGHVSPAAAH